MGQTLGQVIREGRVTKKMTQRQLAEKIKKENGNSITPQYINDIEFDRRTPSEIITREIAKPLDLDPDFLVLLAGAVPQHILKSGITEQQAKQVVSLFRKKRSS